MILFCDSKLYYWVFLPLDPWQNGGEEKRAGRLWEVSGLEKPHLCSEMPRAADVVPALTIMFFISHVCLLKSFS